VASRVPSAPSPDDDDDDDDDDAWTWSTTEIMIAGGKLKNSEKYLPELRHGNSAVLGSITMCRPRYWVALQCRLRYWVALQCVVCGTG
jgi:hypothetical protein